MDSQGRMALLQGWDWPASTATLRETVLYNERVAYAKQDCQQLKGPGEKGGNWTRKSYFP